jgi:hypothetical protein
MHSGGEGVLWIQLTICIGYSTHTHCTNFPDPTYGGTASPLQVPGAAAANTVLFSWMVACLLDMF